MAALDAVVVPSISPWDLLGLELYFLETVAAHRTAPVLVLYALAGPAVSLGRYHLYGGAAERDGILALRRITGGRAVGAGDGWIGLALVLPSRTGLLPERDAGLKPDQVMNRYARGLLAGLRSLGIECFYPGRDAITRERREIAMCMFEIDAAGAMLFEATIAVNRGMEEMIHDLDRLDPDGTIPSYVYSSETSTRLARELNRDVSFEEVSNAIIPGYGDALGGITKRELAAEEWAQAAQRGKALQSIHWLRRSADASQFNRSGRIAAQLGQIEVRLCVSAENRIERAMLCGDFIANSPGVTELEAALEGRTHDLIAVSNAVTSAYAGGNNFILGSGDLSNLVQLIVGAQ
ncbi:MAG: lipoyl protein ligase domain-containing protein [Candidatus Binataceae bacterium]